MKWTVRTRYKYRRRRHAREEYLAAVFENGYECRLFGFAFLWAVVLYRWYSKREEFCTCKGCSLPPWDGWTGRVKAGFQQLNERVKKCHL